MIDLLDGMSFSSLNQECTGFVSGWELYLQRVADAITRLPEYNVRGGAFDDDSLQQ